MRRAWITGASGMLGLALTDYLLKQGVEVTAVIRDGSPKRAWFPRHPHLHLAECSLQRLSDYRPREDERCDAFFHFAWEGTTGAKRNDVYLQNQNVKYTLDAAALAKRLGATVFVGAGSQAEYGRADGKLSPKSPVFPETGYGMAKLCAGQLSRLYCAQNGVRHVWMRVFSVYGPHNVESALVMTAIRSMFAGRRLSCTKGEQRWDYLYAADAARAFGLAAEYGRDGAVYCLGSGEAKPLSWYIEAIREAVAPQAEIGFGDIPYADGQVMVLCADRSSLTADTGFVPEIPFEEGIRKTADWVRKDDEKNQHHGSLL